MKGPFCLAQEAARWLGTVGTRGCHIGSESASHLSKRLWERGKGAHHLGLILTVQAGPRQIQEERRGVLRVDGPGGGAKSPLNLGPSNCPVYPPPESWFSYPTARVFG